MAEEYFDRATLEKAAQLRQARRSRAARSVGRGGMAGMAGANQAGLAYLASTSPDQQFLAERRRALEKAGALQTGVTQLAGQEDAIRQDNRARYVAELQAEVAAMQAKTNAAIANMNVDLSERMEDIRLSQQGAAVGLGILNADDYNPFAGTITPQALNQSYAAAGKAMGMAVAASKQYTSADQLPPNANPNAIAAAITRGELGIQGKEGIKPGTVVDEGEIEAILRQGNFTIMSNPEFQGKSGMGAQLGILSPQAATQVAMSSGSAGGGGPLQNALLAFSHERSVSELVNALDGQDLTTMYARLNKLAQQGGIPQQTVVDAFNAMNLRDENDQPVDWQEAQRRHTSKKASAYEELLAAEGTRARIALEEGIRAGADTSGIERVISENNDRVRELRERGAQALGPSAANPFGTSTPTLEEGNTFGEGAETDLEAAQEQQGGVSYALGHEDDTIAGEAYGRQKMILDALEQMPNDPDVVALRRELEASPQLEAFRKARGYPPGTPTKWLLKEFLAEARYKQRTLLREARRVKRQNIRAGRAGHEEAGRTEEIEPTESFGGALRARAAEHRGAAEKRGEDRRAAVRAALGRAAEAPATSAATVKGAPSRARDALAGAGDDLTDTVSSLRGVLGR